MWECQVFTNHVNATLKKLFPDDNLHVSLLHIMEIIANCETGMTEEVTKAFATARGQSYELQQTKLYMGIKAEGKVLGAEATWKSKKEVKVETAAKKVKVEVKREDDDVSDLTDD